MLGSEGRGLCARGAYLWIVFAALFLLGCDNVFNLITIKLDYETGNDDLVVQVPASELARLDGDLDIPEQSDIEIDTSEVEITLDAPACREDSTSLCLEALPRVFSLDLNDSNQSGVKTGSLSDYQSMIEGIYISSLSASVMEEDDDSAFTLTGVLPPMRVYLSPQAQPLTDQDDPDTTHDWKAEVDNGTLPGWNLCSDTPSIPAGLTLVHLGDSQALPHSLSLPDIYENFPSVEHPITRNLANARQIAKILRGFRFEVIVVPCDKVKIYAADQAALKEQLATHAGSDPRIRLKLNMGIIVAAQPLTH